MDVFTISQGALDPPDKSLRYARRGPLLWACARTGEAAGFPTLEDSPASLESRIGEELAQESLRRKRQDTALPRSVSSLLDPIRT